MRILGIYPGFDIEVDDCAYVMTYLRSLGHDITVICSRESHLKNENRQPEFQDINGVAVHRVYENFSEAMSPDRKRHQKALAIARAFSPDIILCSQQLNMHLAINIRKDLNVPIVLVVEYAANPYKLINRRKHLGITPLAPFVANRYWNWLAENTSAIVTCYIGDVHYLDALSRRGSRAYYVAWCNQIPDGVKKRKREAKRAVYVGSISSRKNSDEFIKTIPLILKRTPIDEIYMVGPIIGPNPFDQIDKHERDRIKYIESLSRREVFELIMDSYFSYTPVKEGGWGFIGDSWAARTPLVATYNEYGLRHYVDSLIADDISSLPETINELYSSKDLYMKLQAEGFNRYKRNHTAEAIGSKMLATFNEVLEYEAV